MYRKLRFTSPEGAIFIPCVDQKLLTLQAIHQDLTPMLNVSEFSDIPRLICCRTEVERKVEMEDINFMHQFFNMILWKIDHHHHHH